MAKIKGIEGMQPDQINFELQRGAKFVIYTYCVSILVMTFKRGSPVHFVRSGESAVTKGLPYCLVSLLLGWWGIPWGPIWTVTTLVNNFKGGKDVTAQIAAAFKPKAQAAAAAAATLPAQS